MWLNFLTMLRRGCWAVAALLLAWSGNAVADINFNGSTPVPATCSLNGNTYTCASVTPVIWNDSIIIASSYTVIVNGPFSPGYNTGFTMSGTAALQTTGNNAISLSSIDPTKVLISGGTITAGGSFTPVSAGKTITANITAASISAANVTINGTLKTTSTINLSDKVTVNGAITAGALTTSGDYTNITGDVSVTGAINFGSNTTVKGAVGAGSITTNATTITKSLTVTGMADLGSSTKIGGDVTANAVKTGSSAQISGAIDSKTTVELGSAINVGGSIKGTAVTTISPATLNGSINASTSFTLASGSTVKGNITSPSITMLSSSSKITGDINTTGTLDMGSDTSITGTVNAGGLLMRAETARIYGTTNITGDVELQSRTSINGDLTARNVTTKNSAANINGNAAVNSIYLDGDNQVTGVITCTGPGAKDCSCVKTAANYRFPLRCAAAPSASVHHFQIKHSGTALTCQAQTVEIKACTDANCTATSSTTTKVTLSPGGGDVDVSGTTNALVRNATATGSGGVTLSATATSVSGATICVNTAANNNSCQMEFKDEGLVLNAPDHVSMTPNVKLNVQALQTSPQGSCVPLVKSATVPIKFSCNYVNPLPANANKVGVTVAGTNFNCGGGTTDINLTFDKDGVATPAPSLQYSEVGQTGLTASYTAGGLGASGAVQFTTAPASIKIEPVRVSSTQRFSATAFAKASEPFTVRLTALNAANNTVKNFGRENPTPQNFAIQAPVMTNPKDGNRPLTIGAYKRITDGVADAVDGVQGQWHLDDTGTLKLTVTLDNSVGYLGNPTKGFLPTNDIELVFVPDHFDVTLLAGAPMDCAKTGLSNPCGSSNANGKFIYSMQPFNVQVSAYTGTKAPGNSNKYLPPQNYVGTAARPITLSAWTAADANAAVSTIIGDFNWNKPQRTAMPFSFSYAAATPTTAEKTTGTVNSALSALPSYDFNTRPTAPTTLFVRAIDSDGATSAGFAEPLLTVVSGQLEIGNISGPLTGTVPVTAKAQYWTGKTYVFNSRFAFDDPTQTQIPSQALTVPLSRTDAGVKTYFVSYANCKNGLYSGTANAPCAASAMPKPNSDSITFKNGVGTLRLNQPTPALTRNGSVDVVLKNGADDLIKYLPSGTGTVIFGVYRSGPIIYMREAYN